MNPFNDIRSRYNFADRDEELIRSIYPLVERHADRIIGQLAASIENLGDPVIDEIMADHPALKGRHREWLLLLFSGPYDNDYYFKLVRIGRVHASLHIRSHYVNVAMNVIRNTLVDMLSDEIEDRARRTALKASLNKLIDINLDIITSSYIEEELQHLSAAYRVKTWLISSAEKFSGVMNMVLVLALIVITLGVMGLFVYDLGHIFQKDMAHGILTSLGNLLILWVLIELMNAEISHLKGGKFNISVFIGVALVAFIRDLMIATLKHETTGAAYYLVATILVLGFVYWLVKRTEEIRARVKER